MVVVGGPVIEGIGSDVDVIEGRRSDVVCDRGDRQRGGMLRNRGGGGGGWGPVIEGIGRRGGRKSEHRCRNC